MKCLFKDRALPGVWAPVEQIRIGRNKEPLLSEGIVVSWLLKPHPVVAKQVASASDPPMNLIDIGTPMAEEPLAEMIGWLYHYQAVMGPNPLHFTQLVLAIRTGSPWMQQCVLLFGIHHVHPGQPCPEFNQGIIIGGNKLSDKALTDQSPQDNMWVLDLHCILTNRYRRGDPAFVIA